MKNTPNTTNDTEVNSTNATMPTVEDLQEMCFEDYKDSLKQQSDGDRHLEVAVDSRPTKAPVQPAATDNPIEYSSQPSRKVTPSYQPSVKVDSSQPSAAKEDYNSWAPISVVGSQNPSVESSGTKAPAERKSYVPTLNRVFNPTFNPSEQISNGGTTDSGNKEVLIKNLAIAFAAAAAVFSLGFLARYLREKFFTTDRSSFVLDSDSEEQRKADAASVESEVRRGNERGGAEETIEFFQAKFTDIEPVIANDEGRQLRSTGGAIKLPGLGNEEKYREIKSDESAIDNEEGGSENSYGGGQGGYSKLENSDSANNTNPSTVTSAESMTPILQGRFR